MKGNKGFTMIELMIVVAVIVVLVMIALPIYNDAVRKSRETADFENLRAAYAKASAKYLEGSEGTADTPPMQTDNKFTINDKLFEWHEKEIVTVVVDGDGVHSGSDIE